MRTLHHFKQTIWNELESPDVEVCSSRIFYSISANFQLCQSIETEFLGQNNGKQPSQLQKIHPPHQSRIQPDLIWGTIPYHFLDGSITVFGQVHHWLISIPIAIEILLDPLIRRICISVSRNSSTQFPAKVWKKRRHTFFQRW